MATATALGKQKVPVIDVAKVRREWQLPVALAHVLFKSQVRQKK